MHDVSHEEFIRLLSERGIEVRVREDRLQVSAPPGALDADLRAELARRKQDLLDRLPRAATSPLNTVSDAERLKPMGRNGKIPQTEAQQGLWLIDHFSPGNVAYNIPQAFLVESAIDQAILQRAIDDLVARHETLRTRLYEEEGELLQAVLTDVSAPMGFTDLSSVPETERDAELHRQIREQARRPFDLDQPPLVRFHLFRLTAQRHAIFFNIHHIVADRQSLVLLRDELGELYRAAALDQAPVLADLPVQYADYALWAARRLSSHALDGQIEYWRSKLSGTPPYFELPLNRPYPEERTAWGATEPVEIPASLRDALTALAQRENASLFIVLLATFAAFLWKCSGQRGFCIGSPLTHRNQVETQPVVGLFVNMLALRCQIDEEQSFRDLLQQVRTTSLEAYENSDLPFQEVVRIIKPDPRLQRSPLFQVMFNFDPDDRPARKDMVQIDTDPGTAKFDLTLQLDARPNGIVGSFEYCIDLFDKSQIWQWSREFVALADAAARYPDRSLREIVAVADAAVAPADTPQVKRLGWRAGISGISRRLAGRPRER